MSSPMTTGGRYTVLAAAFLGWMFAGLQMNLTRLSAGSATEDFARRGWLMTASEQPWHNLLARKETGGTSAAQTPRFQEVSPTFLKQQRPRWAARFDSALLVGAATGGLLFGWLGDRLGRVRAMGTSILCYSLFSGAGYVVITPEQLLVLRFLAGLGIGGMWPTGVSLAAEAWSDVSRPMLAGLLGTAANVGIVLLSVVAYFMPLTPDSWRWMMLLGFPSALLGLWVLGMVPESPAWLAARHQPGHRGTLTALLTPPLLGRTLIGIGLGTVPMLGGWGVTAWFINWTQAVHGVSDYRSAAMTSLMRGAGATLGSLFGGYFATLVGRRTAYFFISLISFSLSEFVYLRLDPTMSLFPSFVFLVGLISTTFFGWLPLYLPELFPTHARATGSGISFNFGRYLTAAGVLGTGALTAYFHEDYRLAGSVMSLIYALGMPLILFAPDTRGSKLAAP
jgi:SHS family sialic acid transporter-like MFS transporter